MKVLITVKTYPTPSLKYDELVCTAGFKEDGSWIRIYPVPFRKLDYANQYKKWQWIDIRLERNTSDFRPETFRPFNIDDDIQMLERVGTEDNWSRRKEIVLQHVHTNLGALIEEAKDPSKRTSLAVFKPKEITDFVWEPEEREWDKKKLDAIFSHRAQGDLFDGTGARNMFAVAEKIPYKFSYKFTTEDGMTPKLMIEDWELGQLFRSCRDQANGDEEVACRKVKEKYFDYMCKERDLYFFLGTTKEFHNVGQNPFIIIGTFYPPKSDHTQLSLF
jgi:hypothetical protein